MNYNQIAILACQIMLTFADICIPSYHPIVGNERTYEVLQRRTFKPVSPNISHFRTIINDVKRNRIIVGARDHIFFLNDTSLETLDMLPWNSTQSKYESCLKLSSNMRYLCGNYIQFLQIYKNQLVMCGTNSMAPKHKIINLTNFSLIVEKQSFDVCATTSPDFPMVGSLTNLGEIIAATGTSDKSEIIGRYLTEKPKIFSATRTTSIAGGKRDLISPNFISSIYVKDSVYLFFMENAIENDNVRTPTVARLCQTDNGGPDYLAENMWTTLRKARLNCLIQDKEKFDFKYLADVTYNEKEELFYAAFSLSRYDRLASAICTYALKDVEASIDSHFVSQDASSGEFKILSNGGFLNGCKVNRSMVSTNPRKTPAGKEPTNSLNHKSVTLALRHKLMAKSVKSRTEKFHFMISATRFSRITTEVLKTAGQNQIDITVFYIGTESGSVYILYQLSNTSTVCIFQEVKTDVGSVKKILLNKEKRVLYISSDEKLISLNVGNCNKLKTESECVSQHSPFCAWSTINNACVSTVTSNMPDTSPNIVQDLSKCPKNREHWDAWSPWKPCKQESSKKYCHCRQRKCQICDKRLCDERQSMQVVNCTANDVKDYSTWLKEGPIDGKWSTWLPWSGCGQGLCGNATMARQRVCGSPLPQNGGRNCSGHSFQCKSCAKKPEPCFLHWSGWSDWAGCTQTKPQIYQQIRTRKCSRLTGCKGLGSEFKHCAPSGIIWDEWSECSCTFRIQHRLPKFIAGCNGCEQLKRAAYQICEPVDCPTTAYTTVITTSQRTTQSTASSIRTSSSKETSKSTSSKPMTKYPKTKTRSVPTGGNHVETQPVVNKPQVHASFKENKDGIKIKLRDLIIATVGILLTCFLACTCIIVIVLKKKKSSFTVPQEVELRSPELYRNKSIGNGIDDLDQNEPLVKTSTKV